MHRHARGAHVQDRRDEVNRAKDGRETRRQQADNDKVEGRPRRAAGRERRIHDPAPAKSIPARRAGHHKTYQKTDKRRRK